MQAPRLGFQDAASFIGVGVKLGVRGVCLKDFQVEAEEKHWGFQETGFRVLRAPCPCFAAFCLKG